MRASFSGIHVRIRIDTMPSNYDVRNVKKVEGENSEIPFLIFDH